MDNFRKAIVAITALTFGAVFTLGLWWATTLLPDPIKIDTTNQPTLGDPKAPLRFVVFEEPKCPVCKRFTLEIYPKIKEKYIDTQKASFTIIPVSFLPDSMPAAEGLLCAFYQSGNFPNNELFFDYIDYMYKVQPPESENWATDEKVKKLAQEASDKINLENMTSCLLTDVYRTQIRSNTDMGRTLMGGRIITPTLYVNGIKVEGLTMGQIDYIVERLEKEGRVKK